jgi:hypothetical protein
LRILPNTSVRSAPSYHTAGVKCALLAQWVEMTHCGRGTERGAVVKQRSALERIEGLIERYCTLFYPCDRTSSWRRKSEEGEARCVFVPCLSLNDFGDFGSADCTGLRNLLGPAVAILPRRTPIEQSTLHLIVSITVDSYLRVLLNFGDSLFYTVPSCSPASPKAASSAGATS